MATKNKGLNRGLDVLLGGQPGRTPPGAGNRSTVAAKSGDLHHLPLELISPGTYQPRRDMDEVALAELAASIKAQGLMQPIVVRAVADNRYEIIAGERRWRASQLAGMSKIPVIIKNVADKAAIAMALIENIQREDLNPMEEALALQRLQAEFELSHEEIGAAVGKSRTTVTNLLRLTQLQPEIRQLLEQGELEMGHARALLGLKGQQQLDTARKVIKQGLSVRQTEALVRRTLQPPPAGAAPAGKSKDTRRLEEQLSEKVGVPVTIQHKANGSGSLSLSYRSLDELEGILEHLRK